MGVKLLCTGDVHLGRPPSRLPDHLDPTAFGPAAVWKATVDKAIDHEVDAVILTGDVVDKDNKFYEAYAALARGVQRLVERDIPVFAVAGNHDFDVFPRLAAEIDGFRLLGAGGQWQETVLELDGRDAIRIVGRSFRAVHERDNPLTDLHLADRSMPTVGLLHCDVDAAGSRYAPVARAELAALSVDAWLLGHIHKPQVISPSGPLVLYPGSPQGLNVNETGPHGPWLIEVEPGRPPAASHLPLAPLRWEHLDVPLNDLDEPEAFDQTISQALKALHERIRGEADALRAVGCRLRLTGRTGVYRDLDRLIAGMRESFTESLPIENVDYFVDAKVANDARPDRDLAQRGNAHDPPGLLARCLLVLQDRDPADEYDNLLDAARKSIATSTIRREFESVTDRALDADDDELAAALLAIGTRALDAMLAQKEDQP